MPGRIPSEKELSKALADATRAAVKELFLKYPDHHFYYFTLTTSGDAGRPGFTAWSHEALAESRYPNVKWSYADSPFCVFGDHHFKEVERLWLLRPPLNDKDDAQWSDEYALRLRAMENAMRTLDEEGLFGTGEARNNVVVLAEVMPPDHTNVATAKRLNPPAALKEWLREAAEPE